MFSTTQILSKIRASINSQKELEYFLIHQDRYKFILDKIQELNLPKGAKVLDIGCHPSHLFNALKDLGFEVWGIASKHEPLKDKNIVSLNLEIDRLPFEQNFFDLILFAEIIEHLVVSPKTYLSELKKILQKDGLLFITTPNAAHLKNRAKLLMGENSYFSLEQLYETGWGNDSIYFRHNREFTAGELRQIMKDCGFQVLKHDFFSAYSPFREKINRERISLKIIKIAGYLLCGAIPGLKDSQYLLVRSN